LSLPLILNIIDRIIDKSITARILKYELKLGLSQIMFSLGVLPYQAYIQTDAITKSIVRQIITKHLLLEWEPAADSEKQIELNLKKFYILMYPGIILALLFLIGYFYVNTLTTSLLLFALVFIWISSPFLAYKLSLPYAEEYEQISLQDKSELRKWSRQAWAFFDLFVDKENNHLPPDNVQLEPYKGVAHRTSPTNIGLALLSNLAAEDLGYISKIKLLKRVRDSLETIKKVPKWNGHIYNWYDTRNLEPLHPHYISTVDSGNFATYLIALKNGLKDLSRRPFIEKTILEGIEDTYFLIEKKDLDNIPEIEDFGRELQELKNNREQFNFKVLYQFISKSLRRLSYLEKNIDYVKDKNIVASNPEFWITCLSRMFEDYKKAIEWYYPYLLFEDVPQFLEKLPKLNARLLIKEYFILLSKERLPKNLRILLKKGLKHSVITLLWSSKLQEKLKKIIYEMDFKFLFDKQKELFSIGYNISEQRLDNSYYDLLASEARQTSLFAIAKGDVPEAHWFKLARPLTRIERNRCLVSWSGTMFEFLMPLILFKNFRGTLLDETYRSVVRIQQSYTRKGQAPWGISESGFFSFDPQSNYQYKAFGVPDLGLKRGLSKDMVISPYSTFMALAVDCKKSIANLKRMKEKGFNGIYGLYEAIDFTKARVPYNEESSVVKSYMSHHLGMSFISLNNVLNNNKMQERFHREPRIKSIELLLQERVPLKEYSFNPSIEEIPEQKVLTISRQQGERPAIYYSPDTKLPRTSLISNREYSVMLTLGGTGYSQYNDIYVTRWREDPTIDMYGSFIYVQNLNSGNMWSATSKPLNYPGEEYKVTCFPNSVRYSRKDGNIITQTEVLVAPEDPVEIRKVSLTNLSKYSRDIQLTSYFEIVLEQFKADIAHPTFSKLFIRTRFENDTLIAFRRPRHHDQQKIFLMHTFFVDGEMLGEAEYETDRTRFIGRGRTLADPKALDINQPLSNSVGAVLDPIMSLRSRVRINAGQTVVVYYLTGVGEKKELVLRLAQKYKSRYAVNQAKDLAWSQNLMELTNLNLSFNEANKICSLASQVIFPGPLRRKINIKNNRLGQSSLWPLGISGDLPIILLKIQDNNQIKLVDQMLKIHEYWKIKGLFVDLVILNEDNTGYFQTIQEMIHEKIGISHVRKLVNKPGGVFLLKKDQLLNEVILLLHTVSRIIFSGEYGSLNNQILRFVRLTEQNLITNTLKKYTDKQNNEQNIEVDNICKVNEIKGKLIFYNGYGGFSQEGKEYVIVNDDNPTPLPWVNVIANPIFGTLVTEAGSSYTWSQNSREYKLSPWSNDPLLDISGEALYLRDEKTGIYWSPTPQPVKDDQPYVTRHGQGYSRFEHNSKGIKQETTIYVSLNKSIKIIKLRLTNITNSTRQLSAYYYLEWVLGVNREENAPYLVTESKENTICCHNVYQEEFCNRVAFVRVFGESLKSFTCDRQEFIGVNRTLKNPLGLENEQLSGKTGYGIDPCAVVQIEVDLGPIEEKTIYFLIGDEENKDSALFLAENFSCEKQLTGSFQEVLNYWDDLLSTIQIRTPEPTLDILFNRWLVYQTLSCRIWARSAFYQSGGAIGFRDQLQDVMSFSVLRPEITRKQIVLHSSRQFPEGDVQHWWHPEKGKGIRTKFSDDLLWLPYVTADYIEHTGDVSILDERTPFLDQELLGKDENERYAIPVITGDWATVYEHCVRAIDHSLKFGQHGLPLIGTGDWNDGFSAIGREGKGESIWLGWFLLSTLKAFLPLCGRQGDLQRLAKYEEIINILTENIEKNAWDGSWYRRAYYDDGSPLGSITNTECQIDSIAQSWAVISQGAKQSRVADAILAMERYLWDKNEAIFKLFTPPFDKTEKNPGYIRGYIPGVRENGGQYTHAAIWAVLALTKLGEKDKALELFNMLNPINHSRTNAEVTKYKVEPYVMAADVYTIYPNVGRGGWSWYTGAAGWMYQVALEGILGFNIKKDKLTLSPCVPYSWDGYTINYRFKTSEYNIKIKFVNTEKKGIMVDGTKQESFPIELKDDGKKHEVEVLMVR
jgi:cyclic beta-1,2-glucan synthetase